MPSKTHIRLCLKAQGVWDKFVSSREAHKGQGHSTDRAWRLALNDWPIDPEIAKKLREARQQAKAARQAAKLALPPAGCSERASRAAEMAADVAKIQRQVKELLAKTPDELIIPDAFPGQDWSLYSMIWRNRWLPSDPDDIEDVVDALRAAADELEALNAAGITIGWESNLGQGHLELQTTSAVVAAAFGMKVVEEEEGDEPPTAETAPVPASVN
jgi:hypothetical protein